MRPLALLYPSPLPLSHICEGFRRWVRPGRGASAFLFFKMFHILLYQPEIPPNTGNVIRLCANTGAKLRLIKPLGFVLEDKQLLRAGLDYHEFASMSIHENWQDCLAHMQGRRIFAISTKGKQRYDLASYTKGDALLFGPESRGLPVDILESFSNNTGCACPW